MVQSSARHSALIRKEAPQSEVDALGRKMELLRGMHSVWIDHLTEYDREAQKSYRTGWRKLCFRGTDRGVLGGKNVLAMSGLQELDPNADHNHEACLARAREMGVPPEWAHRPETYLST